MARKDISIIMTATTIPKKPAAPRSAAKFYATITNPLASAKFAMDHMKNQIVVMKLST
jgi:hypothetical protein